MLAAAKISVVVPHTLSSRIESTWMFSLVERKSHIKLLTTGCWFSSPVIANDMERKKQFPSPLITLTARGSLVFLKVLFIFPEGPDFFLNVRRPPELLQIARCVATVIGLNL